MSNTPPSPNPYESPREAIVTPTEEALSTEEIARRLRPPLIAIAIIAGISLLFDLCILGGVARTLMTESVDPLDEPLPENIILLGIMLLRPAAMLSWSIHALRGAIRPWGRLAAIAALIPCSTFLIFIEWPIGLWLWIALRDSQLRRPIPISD
jgi:hypothetical protein